MRADQCLYQPYRLRAFQQHENIEHYFVNRSNLQDRHQLSLRILLHRPLQQKTEINDEYSMILGSKSP